MQNKSEDKVIKQFGLSNFSLKNRITVVLIFILLVVLGVGAYNNLPKESYPEVEQSTVFVGTPYPGNSPTDIENLITRPIEKEINTISEIKEIRSNSIQGFSTIVAEFVSGTNIEYAKSKIKDAVDRFILSVSENGYGKRSSYNDYRVTNRGGKGIIGIINSPRNGNISSSLIVSETDEILLSTDKGSMMRCAVKEIRIAGRNTQGVRIKKLSGEEKVVSVIKIEDNIL